MRRALAFMTVGVRGEGGARTRVGENTQCITHVSALFFFRLLLLIGETMNKRANDCVEKHVTEAGWGAVRGHSLLQLSALYTLALALTQT